MTDRQMDLATAYNSKFIVLLYVAAKHYGNLPRQYTEIFMPPTSEEVKGAYWFGSVRAVQ